MYGHHLILNEEPARLAHMARYAMRPPVALDRVHRLEDGRVLLRIDPDPGTQATTLRLDPMEWIWRVTSQSVSMRLTGIDRDRALDAPCGSASLSPEERA